MNWELLAIACGIWILFGVHFIFAERLKLMADAGLPIQVEGNSMLIASKALCQLAILNLIIFCIAFGIYVSWWQAAGILLGGYACSFVYMLTTRGPVFDSLINPTHKLGWVALPTLSVVLWLRGFNG